MKKLSVFIPLSIICLSLVSINAVPALARVTGPPLARPAYQPPPKASDHVLYEQIFELQEKARWGEADKLIRQLADKSLLGHIYRLRYMHPTAYRASWKEMKEWLSLYGDHPGAWQVYKLAQKRRPRGAKMPKAPPSRIWHQAKSGNSPKLFYARSSRNIKREVRQLTYKERPTQALKYINRRSVDKLLKAEETDSLRAHIARSYYIEGKPEKSLELAQLATRSRATITTADWTAGLAAWRLDKVEMALKHFQYLTNNQAASKRYRTAASFWSARCYDVLGDKRMTRTMLKKAVAIGEYNFYALIAEQRLERGIDVDWGKHKNVKTDTLDKHDALARAKKLLKAHQQELAELELLYLGERLTDKEAAAMLSFAREENLPAVELSMTHRLDLADKTLSKNADISLGQYPIPAYSPTTGYQLDKAVLFGLIRQESRFKARAKSYAGARGLMQIMPATAAFVTGDRKLRYRSDRDKLYRISLNMNIGQAYLEGLLKDNHINNNLLYALASYNAGPGNVRRWIREIGNVNDPLLFMESMPAPETRLYIQRVMGNIWLYRDRLNQNPTSLVDISMGKWPIYQAQEVKLANQQ